LILFITAQPLKWRQSGDGVCSKKLFLNFRDHDFTVYFFGLKFDLITHLYGRKHCWVRTKAGIALAGARVDYARAESALKSSKKRLTTAMDLAWPLWLQLRNCMVVMCLQAAKIK
jgi:hypothetical protein